MRNYFDTVEIFMKGLQTRFSLHSQYDILDFSSEGQLVSSNPAFNIIRYNDYTMRATTMEIF